VRRERTGEGALLDVAILDAVVGWLGPLGAGVATAGVATGPLAGLYPCYGVYAAADGAFLAVGALEPPFWVAFCRAVGREDLVPRQYDRGAVPDVAAVLAARPRAEWLALLAEHACVAPVNAPAEAERDPQVRARGLVVGEGSMARVRSPLATGDDGSRPAPGLGADTREVLAAAGIGPAERAVLERDGVVGGPTSVETTARAERLAGVLARLAERGREGTQAPDAKGGSAADRVATDGSTGD
jgi:crotonobetainyl-CoA:carnitine CoA-transferase CaiB-like acyl-CoA transferase